MPVNNPEPEPIQANNIIVLHPGSLNLRFGRACDLNPICIMNVIARKRKKGGLAYRDSFLPECVPKTKELLQEMEEGRLQVSHTLQSCVQSNGRRRYATPPQQISAFNRRSAPEVIDQPTKKWKQLAEEFIVGEEVLDLDPNGEYNVHFPIRRGELNLHENVGGAITSVISDLEQILEYALVKKLRIDLKNINSYKAVLVIPDIFNRAHLKELATLLLNRIGFGSCFFVQDHVSSTFGTGYAYACVLDVGDQKTSISCVEDGISYPTTRVRLEYGGADVSQTFFWLLQKCAFPYKECSDTNPQDAILLKKLKEDYCHCNLDVCGSEEKSFVVTYPQKPKRYIIQVGDELLVAPLSLFHTELLSLTVHKSTPKTQKLQQVNSEDCFDAEYLRETGRRGVREALEQNITEGNNDQDDDMVEGLEAERETKTNEREFILPNGQIMGLDLALIQSIERCPNEELKRKMYGCILVVGGGMKFPGIGNWLQNKIALKIPVIYRSDNPEIVISPSTDPAITAWKGACIMSCLESACELWINQTEWNKYGLRILREKAPFQC